MQPERPPRYVKFIDRLVYDLDLKFPYTLEHEIQLQQVKLLFNIAEKL